MKVIKILISYICKCTDYLKGKNNSCLYYIPCLKFNAMVSSYLYPQGTTTPIPMPENATLQNTSEEESRS